MSHRRYIDRTLLIALAGTLLWSCTEPTVQEEIIRPVQYQVVSLSEQATVRRFAGVSSAGVESNLSFRVRGNIEELLVSVGDHISAGDVVARLDETDYTVALGEAEASVSAARAQQRNAEAEHERIRLLWENGSASRSELDAARAAADSTRAAVRANRQRVQAARDQLSYCTLASPIDGSIAAVPVEVNENVLAGQTVAVLTTGMQEQLGVSVAIPGTLIARISQGMAVQVSFGSLAGRSFDAEVTEVGVSAISGATFPVKVRLIELNSELRAGMTAEVTFDFGSALEEPRIWLPIHAVAGDREGSFVFVVHPDPERETYGQVERREVVIGDLDERGLEILEGIEDGELIVTLGISQIDDGQTVRVLSPEGR